MAGELVLWWYQRNIKIDYSIVIMIIMNNINATMILIISLYSSTNEENNIGFIIMHGLNEARLHLGFFSIKI